MKSVGEVGLRFLMIKRGGIDVLLIRQGFVV